MLNIQFTYQLVRSHRRTLGLEVTEKGELIVRAPMKASLREIEDLLQEKEHWILRNQESARQKLRFIKPKQFIAGEAFLYLGQEYRLTVLSSSKVQLHFAEEFFLAEKALPKAERLFLRWYYEQAYQYIAQRAAYYAAHYGFEYQSIRITNPKRRWGSCSPDNVLNFTWRLIMAPPVVIDYVIVHELAHTLHKNHKKRFWQKVAKVFPGYEIQRRWLKEYGHLLTI